MLLHSHIEQPSPSPQHHQDLVVLHGLFGNWENWRTPIKQLATDRRVLGLDLRNHGKSPHDDEMDYILMAQDVAETLDQLGIKRCSVLGHSMGGKVAMALTTQLNTTLDSLIIVDIAAREYAAHHTSIIRAMRALNLAQIDSRKTAELALSSSVEDRMTRQFLLKNLERSSLDSSNEFRWTLNLAAIDSQYPHLQKTPPLAEQFTRPMLLIRGALSDYVEEPDIEKLCQWATQCRVETIDGAGHWPHASHASEVIGLIKEFLKEVDLSAN